MFAAVVHRQWIMGRAVIAMATSKIHWNIKVYEEKGPLTDSQIQRLAIDHDLPIELLHELGIGLAHALNPNTNPRDLRKFLASGRKGKAAFEKAMREIEVAEEFLERATKRLDTVHFIQPQDFPMMSSSSETLFQDLERGLDNIRVVRTLFLKNADQSTTPYFRGIADKRLERDDRRIMVCRAIFRIWEASGRRVTMTTDTDNSERLGDLINFLNATVGMVTSPPARLNGETIRAEIDSFKRLKA